jgi:hypothetical protein
MQRADPRIAAPGKHQAVRATHADELVVDDIRRHADQIEVLAPLADHLVAGRVRDQMGESFHRDGIAVANGGFHGLGEGQNLRHRRFQTLRC